MARVIDKSIGISQTVSRTLKDRKEEFVSGLSGGSIGEINAVTAIALVGYVSWCLINRNSSLFSEGQKWSSLSVTVDFLLNWIGLLLSITIYASSPLTLAVAIVTPAVLVSLTSKHNHRQRTKLTKGSASAPATAFLPKKPFITAYRGSMMIITALAILAVDFPVFPRRFAKVETWGTSLMDLGVGSFVFSMGIVSSRSIILEDKNGGSGYFTKLYKSLRSTMTPLVLGLLRLVLVKNLEYQEHVTEYGVHWNFFITLVLVGPLSILLSPLFSYIPRAVVSIVISLVYEYLICQKEGFLSYLLVAPRIDLLSSNREGVFSLLGYLAIYLAGQSTGFYVLPSQRTKNNLFKPSMEVKYTGNRFTSVSPIAGLITWFLTYFVLFKFVQNNHYYSVSRRLANLPYVLWVSAYNTGFLLCYAIIDKYMSPEWLSYESRIPISLDAINSNGMVMFLLANVTTGLTNMSLNTLDCSNSVSIIVLVLYSAFLAIVGASLYKMKIFVKL